jgi:hypothetical protein
VSQHPPKKKQKAAELLSQLPPDVDVEDLAARAIGAGGGH